MRLLSNKEIKRAKQQELDAEVEKGTRLQSVVSNSIHLLNELREKHAKEKEVYEADLKNIKQRVKQRENELSNEIVRLENYKQELERSVDQKQLNIRRRITEEKEKDFLIRKKSLDEKIVSLETRNEELRLELASMVVEKRALERERKKIDLNHRFLEKEKSKLDREKMVFQEMMDYQKTELEVREKKLAASLKAIEEKELSVSILAAENDSERARLKEEARLIDSKRLALAAAIKTKS